MLDLIRPTYDFNLSYAKKLTVDVPDEQMCAQPVPGVAMNHAAFTLGHLVWVKENLLRLLGQERPRVDEWKELFGMGAKPLADRARYPAKDELLKALEEVHAALGTAVASASADTLAQPAPERMRGRFPTMGPMFAGLMTAHYATHLGQLSAWRRALGLPSIF